MKKILSIDGGGMKGYVPCSVLVELEKRMGKPCYEVFDMVSGTSIGGILACLINVGKSASEALEFFTVDGPAIFGHGQFWGAGGITEPRYGSDNIEKCLSNRLGDKKISDCKKSLLVPAFDLVSYEPYFFKKSNKDYLLWQVARATSAAQTYFPAFSLDDMVLWDGGNVANNPAACALAEGLKLWGPDGEISVLSIGCGANKSKYDADDLINAGIVRVGGETMSLLFDTNDELPNYILSQFIPQSYCRIQPILTQELSIDGSDDDCISKLKFESDKCVKDFSEKIDLYIKSIS